MHARRLEPRVLCSRAVADPGLDAGRAAAEEARRRWSDMDALLCFNDAVAVGVIKQLGETGVAVPGETAVVGIDGLPLGLVVTPELTTLRFDLEGVAEVATELMVEIAAGRVPLRGS